MRALDRVLAEALATAGDEVLEVLAPTCKVGLVNPSGQEVLCGTPADGRYRFACVHEHVGEKWACKRCAEHPGSYCGPCSVAGHDCQVLVERIGDVNP